MIKAISEVSGTHMSGSAAVIRELVKNGSIELTERNSGAITDAKELLPYGMNVYLPAIPGKPLLSIMDSLQSLRTAGYDPVPHIAARRIPARSDLKQFLQRAVGECGVHRVLLIGGDIKDSDGPYADSLDVLRDGVLQETGIREVGFAGYPEGHPRIPQKVLQQALDEKLGFAADTGLGCYIITQFSFAPKRIVEYCAALAHAHPQVPVYVGMAGPTSTVKLIKYAKLCGVSASLRALTDMGFKAATLISHTEPSKQVAVLARYCGSHESCNVIGIHVFSFGGFNQSASWMRNLLNNGTL